jgi:hypothetical protein
MLCTKCGNDVKEAKFCSKCGAVLGMEVPKQESGINSSVPQPASAQASRMRKADEVEFKIHGDDLQSLPFSRLADRIYSASKGGGKRKDEGSLLGNIGIGNFFGGDD